VLQLDVVILEVGMGGRLDSTNVVPSPIVCGIASIGFDHMEVLGDTLPLIAREKAGIIKPAVPALTIPQLPEVIATLTDCAREEGSSLTIVPLIPSSTPLGLDGNHQLENASLAVALCRRVLQHRSRTAGVKVMQEVESDTAALPAEFLSGLQATRWAGRCQLYADSECSNLSFFVDGAHTDASMAVACRWFQQQVLRQPQQTAAVTAGSSSSADASSDDGEELCLVSSSPPLSSSPPAYNVLLFNAGHVRNPFDLLQPVVSLGLSDPLCQFGSFLSCPFDHVRPHLSSQPAFDTVLAQQPQALQRFAAHSLPALSPPPQQQQTWQHTLFRTFDLLLAYNQKGREERGESAPASGNFPPGSTGAPVYPHRNVYMGSSAQAVLSVRRLALRHPKVQFRVLVCGSLYLVGNVLEKLGHRAG
jgi:folylpolyglutamate synthase